MPPRGRQEGGGRWKAGKEAQDSGQGTGIRECHPNWHQYLELRQPLEWHVPFWTLSCERDTDHWAFS